MRPVHPGEILREELEEIEMSANALAEKLAVPRNRVSAILNGRLGVTADTAVRLSRYLGTTPEFWINLQKVYEFRQAEVEAGDAIARQVKPRGQSSSNIVNLDCDAHRKA